MSIFKKIFPAKSREIAAVDLQIAELQQETAKLKSAMAAMLGRLLQMDEKSDHKKKIMIVRPKLQQAPKASFKEPTYH